MPFGSWKTPPSVNRCRMSFAIGPQSTSQFMLVGSPGCEPKSLAMFIPFVSE